MKSDFRSLLTRFALNLESMSPNYFYFIDKNQEHFYCNFLTNTYYLKWSVAPNNYYETTLS